MEDQLKPNTEVDIIKGNDKGKKGTIKSIDEQTGYYEVALKDDKYARKVQVPAGYLQKV